MKNVLLLQGFSNLTDMINELDKRNIVPTILVAKDDILPQFTNDINKLMSTYPKNIKIIRQTGSYEQMVKTLKKLKFDEMLYISETNVKTASRLSRDLKIPGHPYSKINSFLGKEYMHKALKKHGIRYIRGKTARNVGEIIKIFHEFGDKPIVLKPSRGAGTVTVKFCKTIEDIKNYGPAFFDDTNILTNAKNTEALVQEWIFGREYVVNSQVIRGKTFLSTLGKYDLMEWNNKLIYRNFEFLSENDFQDIGVNNLVQYAYEVNKAIGVQNGFIHSEFYIDEKGPILIEINCRTMGGPFRADFQTDIFTFSEFETFTNTHLFPESYDQRLQHQYNVFEKGILSFLISSVEGKIKSIPFKSLIKRFKTFDPKYNKDLIPIGDKMIKTIDFETVVGRAYLKGNAADVKAEDDFIKTINFNYFYMLFELENEPNLKCWAPKGQTAADFIKDNYKLGPTLFLKDYKQEIPYVKSTSINDIDKQLGNYYYGVMNFKKKPNLNREQIIDVIFNFLSKIRIGGYFFVPNECIQFLPYGNSAYEIICKIAGFKPVAPIDNIGGFLAQRIK